MDVTADNDAVEICRSVMASVPAGTAAHLPCTVERVVEHHGTYVVMAGVDGGSLDRDEALMYWKQSYFGEMTPVAPDIKGRW